MLLLFEYVCFKFVQRIFNIQINTFGASGLLVVSVDILGENVSKEDFRLRQAEAFRPNDDVFIGDVELSRR